MAYWASAIPSTYSSRPTTKATLVVLSPFSRYLIKPAWPIPRPSTLDSDTQDTSLTETRTDDPPPSFCLRIHALLIFPTCVPNPLCRLFTNYTFRHLASTPLTDLADFFIIHGLGTLLLIQKTVQKHPFTFACSFNLRISEPNLHPTFTLSLKLSKPIIHPALRILLLFHAPLFPLTS
jgi:hypothetical protein